MSRTYRRTMKGQKRSWIFSPWSKVCWKNESISDVEDWFYNKYPHRIKDRKDYHYWMKTPSDWNRLYHTKRRRAAERDLITKIKNGQIDADNVSWPDGLKPEIYYW